MTFRLADSIPRERLDQWSSERKAWLKWNQPPWSAKQQHEYDERFTGTIERWLDEGALPDAVVRSEVETNLRHFDGVRHWNLAWVIMPNHIHVIFALSGGWRLEQILHAWKGYSAKQANLILHRHGELWQKDYFDRMIRDSRHFWRCARYIRRNPETAKLKPAEFTTFEADWVKRKLDEERSGGLRNQGGW